MMVVFENRDRAHVALGCLGLVALACLNSVYRNAGSAWSVQSQGCPVKFLLKIG